MRGNNIYNILFSPKVIYYKTKRRRISPSKIKAQSKAKTNTNRSQSNKRNSIEQVLWETEHYIVTLAILSALGQT